MAHGSSKEEKTGNIGYVKAIGTGKNADGKLVPMRKLKLETK